MDQKAKQKYGIRMEKFSCSCCNWTTFPACFALPALISFQSLTNEVDSLSKSFLCVLKFQLCLIGRTHLSRQRVNGALCEKSIIVLVKHRVALERLKLPQFSSVITYVKARCERGGSLSLSRHISL